MSKIKQEAGYLSAGKPIHKLSYCAFLDVLGFSQRLRASYMAGNGDALLREFHSILKRRIVALKRDTEDSLLYFKSFTDNVVLAHPQFSRDMESEFGFIMWSILRYQFEMALAGFFVRGGLAVGQLFVDENSVYGEALLESYELESKVAVNPVVVLSDDVMSLVDLHITYYSGESPQHRAVLVGQDGRYFLNYLSETVVDAGDYDKLDVISLRKHKLQIEKSLKDQKPNPAVFSKFCWLAAYHNNFCDSVAGYSDYNGDLKIDTDLSSIKFSRLTKKPPK